MPEIPEIRIPEIPVIPEPNLPKAPNVTLELGPMVIDMPGCVKTHPDANRNARLLEDDPTRAGAYCPHGEIPSYEPMEFTPNQFVLTEPAKPKKGKDDETEQQTPKIPVLPRIPTPNAPTTQGTEVPAIPKPLLEKVVDGLPSVEATVTTTVIAVVATTSALVAKPFAELILKTIKPTVKKTMTTIAKLRGQTIPLESVWERRISQRERNLAVRTLRRALKP